MHRRVNQREEAEVRRITLERTAQFCYLLEDQISGTRDSSRDTEP